MSLPEQMQALVFAGERQIAYETVSAPKLIHATDAIVRVTLCAICGR